MNLPHQKPIRFAKSILKNEADYKIVSCVFPSIPTLAMVSEAAAQSSASYAQDNDAVKMGFLISLKNITLLKNLEECEYEIKIEKSFNFGIMTEFTFELMKDNHVYVSGSLTVAIPDDEDK